MLTGKHYITGEWVETDGRFSSQPVKGVAQEFCVGTPALVEKAVIAAERAFEAYAATSRDTRANFLTMIADEIDARGDEITEVGSAETGLPEARLQGERGRTVGQLRLFANHIRLGDYLDRRYDIALPDRAPLPRPKLRMVQRPIGPVAVFGASNFPLAFSVAGGDTASALAAGCPVVVKGHSAHPGTSEIVAQAIAAAADTCNMSKGIFALIQGGRRDVGEALVQHPLINAVGFTGSLSGGRALFDLVQGLHHPLLYELGSINPVFVLPEAGKARAADIGTTWAGSLTMGAGQFCTNPGVVFIEERPPTRYRFRIEALTAVEEQAMLTDGIAKAYRQGVAGAADRQSGEVVGTNCAGREALPIFRYHAETWSAEPHLAEEVFGPLGIVVRVPSLNDFAPAARAFVGQLTATLHMDAGDTELAASLLPILERKVGRILANGFPTGVEVSDTMVHGGPYPASTNFGATSVGTLSIRRWLRPVCYQAMPDSILPKDAIG